MEHFRRISFVACLAFIAFSTTIAEETESNDVPAASDIEQFEMQPLIHFDSSQPYPFTLNQNSAEVLNNSNQSESETSPSKPVALNNDSTPVVEQIDYECELANDEVANEKLAKIKDDITELITKYPSTRAAKEAAEILDKAGLQVIPKSGIYDKDVIVLTIPITR